MPENGLGNLCWVGNSIRFVTALSATTATFFLLKVTTYAVIN
jgi:hypothetical protein